jgi:hypothetical protein
MSRFPNPMRVGVAAAALLLSACSDSPVAVTPPEPVKVLAALRCTVEVAAQTMSCASVAPEAGGANLDLIVGFQDVLVKLSSSGTAYDGGTQILSSNITVQNLVSIPMGTPDGNTVTGVNVFFHTGPTVTVGTGTVDLANEDGTGTFTAAGQPYYFYNEILTPLEISSPKQWQFSVPATVTSFVFTAYVSAAYTDETGYLLDEVTNIWDGSTDVDFANAANWTDNTAPTSGESVTIPADSLVAGAFMPVLGSNFSLAHLRVGYQSTFGLGGFTATANGNVDALGTISNGTLQMSGTGALLRGNVNALAVTGSTFLQGSTKATGAVNVIGTLTTNGNALTISIP